MLLIQFHPQPRRSIRNFRASDVDGAERRQRKTLLQEDRSLSPNGSRGHWIASVGNDRIIQIKCIFMPRRIISRELQPFLRLLRSANCPFMGLLGSGDDDPLPLRRLRPVSFTVSFDLIISNDLPRNRSRLRLRRRKIKRRILQLADRTLIRRSNSIERVNCR